MTISVVVVSVVLVVVVVVVVVHEVGEHHGPYDHGERLMEKKFQLLNPAYHVYRFLQLSQDCVMVFRKSSPYLGQYIIDINRLISDRINNCRALFPTWLNWEYLKSLFIMPE